MVDYIDASHEGMHKVLVDNGFTFEANVNRWAEERTFWSFVYKSERFDLAIYVPKGAIYVIAKSLSTRQHHCLSLKKFADVAAYFVGKDYESPGIDFISQAHREMHKVLLNVGFTLDCNNTRTNFVDFNGNTHAYDFLYKNYEFNTSIFFQSGCGRISVHYTAFNYDNNDINNYTFSDVVRHYNALSLHRENFVQYNNEYQIMHNTLLSNGFIYNVTAWGNNVDFEYSKNDLTLGFANNKEFCVEENKGMVGSEEWNRHFCVYRYKSFKEITQLINSDTDENSGFELINEVCRNFHCFLIENGFIFQRSSFYGFSFGYKNDDSKVEIYFDKEDCIKSYGLFNKGYKETTISEVVDFISNKRTIFIEEEQLITEITPELLTNNGWTCCVEPWNSSGSWFLDGCSIRLPYQTAWTKSESYCVCLPFDKSIDNSGGASTTSVDYVLKYLKDNGLELYTDIKFINSDHRKMHNVLLKNGFKLKKNAQWDYIRASFGYENSQTNIVIYHGGYRDGIVSARKIIPIAHQMQPIGSYKNKYAFHFLNKRSFKEVTEYFSQQESVAC